MTAVGSEPGSSWVPLDLSTIVDGLVKGTLSRPAPTIGPRNDGACLLYARAVNGIGGPPASGKSLLALSLASQHMAAHGGVLWVDHEDHEISVVGRLLDLGGAPQAIVDQFLYVHPSEGYGVFAEQTLTDVLADLEQLDDFLVVIDSAGESMALDGKDGNKDPDVAGWFARLPKQLADRGACVLVIDHVVKDSNADSLWPIGSQRKLAAISGAQYMLQPARPFTKNLAGSARLICAKDRHGNYARGAKVAEFTVEPKMGLIVTRLVAPAVGSEFRPTFLMERISRWLELNPGATTRAIRDDVNGNHAAKSTALQMLIAEGFVTVDKVGQGHQHRVAKPYREADEEGAAA